MVLDAGKAPDKKFSSDYQAGLLSFEFHFLGEKVITNSGYFQDYKHQLNIISKSTATPINTSGAMSKILFNIEYKDANITFERHRLRYFRSLDRESVVFLLLISIDIVCRLYGL